MVTWASIVLCYRWRRHHLVLTDFHQFTYLYVHHVTTGQAHPRLPLRVVQSASMVSFELVVRKRCHSKELNAISYMFGRLCGNPGQSMSFASPAFQDTYIPLTNLLLTHAR